MKRELEQQLIEKYPKLFGDYGKSPMESCMAFGCDCGDGWYEILARLCASLEKYEDDVVFAQIKEKFGGLRVYFNGAPKEIFDDVCKIIDDAEEESYKVCEGCGKEGKLYDRGWWRVHCQACEEKYQARFSK